MILYCFSNMCRLTPVYWELAAATTLTRSILLKSHRQTSKKEKKKRFILLQQTLSIPGNPHRRESYALHIF